MARVSALMWPDDAQPTRFCDRTDPTYKARKAKLQSTISALTREIKKRPDAWPIDALPYSTAFERFVHRHTGVTTTPILATVYQSILRLRKTGELAPRKAKAPRKVPRKVPLKLASTAAA